RRRSCIFPACCPKAGPGDGVCLTWDASDLCGNGSIWRLSKIHHSFGVFNRLARRLERNRGNAIESPN
ncbi:MAG TPA: hypothetical protein PLU99_06310, partial [Phycisphaerae bacterium]|nr:hypothetical protein [Phycisphaerae bacterium]